VRGVVALPDHQGRLHGVEVGLLLKLANVFLVADSLVAEPVAHLAMETTTTTTTRGSVCALGLKTLGECSSVPSSMLAL